MKFNKFSILFLIITLNYSFSFSQIHSIEKIQSLSKSDLKKIWRKNNIPSLICPINNPLEIYKIKYYTSWIDNSKIIASGLYYKPKTNFPVSTVIYHHGTKIIKKSSNEINGENIASLIFGVDGYAVISPDYIGLGEGEKTHLYCKKESEARACIDFLNVTEEINNLINLKINDDIFITGYSQGGHAAMSTHMILERDYIEKYNIKGASPMSGPYDLAGIQSEIAYKNYSRPFYLPYLLLGFNIEYKIWTTEDFFGIFKEEYQANVRKLFDNSDNINKINNLLPKIPILMLKDSFVNEFKSNENFPLHKYLKDNSVYDWKPIAPIQLCFCESDEEVLYENSILAYNTFKKNGSKFLKLKSAGRNYNHNSCAGPALIYSKVFFDKKRSNKKKFISPTLQKIFLRVYSLLN